MTEKQDLLRRFIQLYDAAKDKEAFMDMWREAVNVDKEPLMLSDAFDAVEGEAWAQVYANQEG